MANLSSTRIFGDGTVERSLYVKQRLGVGVGSPDYAVDVFGDIRLNANGSSNGKAQVRFNEGSGTNAYIGYDGNNLNGGDNRLEFNSNGTHMVVQNRGRVGIGTTSPQHQLTVEGNNAVASLDGANTNGTPMLHIGEQGEYGIGFRWDSGRNLDIVQFDAETISNSGGTKVGHFRVRDEEFYWKGNVGIGTNSPGARLDVDGNMKLSNSGGNEIIEFITEDDNHCGINFRADGSENIVSFEHYTNGTDYLTVDYNNNGNVGIGTNSPNQKLDVEGAVDVNGRLNMRGNDINDVRRINGDNGNHRIRFDDNNSYIEFSDQSNNRRQVVARDVYIDEDNYWIGSLNLENHVNDSNAHHSRYTDSEASQISGSSVSKNIDGTGSGAPNARGYQVSWDSDFAFFGLVDLGNDNKHVAIANEQQSDDFKFYSAAANIVTITGGGTIRADGDVVAFYSSDRRLKKNPTQVENPMTKIEKLTGVGFGWKEKASREGKGFGIFAQDAKKIDDRLVRKQGDGYLGVDYQQLHGIEIEALKQINEKVEENQSEIQRLKQRIEKLESNDNAI